VPEPLPVHKLRAGVGPIFVRKITRRRHWEDALDQKNPQLGADVFKDESGSTSLWKIESDVGFRRVALAMNEGRGSLHEQIDLLAIVPRLFDELKLRPFQYPGITDCPVASALHYEVKLDAEAQVRLAAALIQTKVSTIRCKKSDMRDAENASIADGCLTVPQNSKCLGCSASR
jgi:hypothetical protein